MFLFIMGNCPKGLRGINVSKKTRERTNEQKKRQVKKGRRWMPWLLEAMKDVTSCDKPGRGANNRLNPGFPNGATHHVSGILVMRKQTRGTETSKYPQEKKTKVIAPVVASERATAQT